MVSNEYDLQLSQIIGDKEFDDGKETNREEATARCQNLFNSLIQLSEKIAKTEQEEKTRKAEEVKAYNNLYFYLKYLKRKNQGPDIDKVLRKEYESMLNEFLGPEDWAKDLNRVMVKRLEDPEMDLDGDGQNDQQQNEEAGVKANKGTGGQMIGGTFYTKS